MDCCIHYISGDGSEMLLRRQFTAKRILTNKKRRPQEPESVSQVCPTSYHIEAESYMIEKQLVSEVNERL